jgi:hypothetical protein
MLHLTISTKLRDVDTADVVKHILCICAPILCCELPVYLGLLFVLSVLILTVQCSVGWILEVHVFEQKLKDGW